jgi:hypothetical protein
MLKVHVSKILNYHYITIHDDKLGICFAFVAYDTFDGRSVEARLPP